MSVPARVQGWGAEAEIRQLVRTIDESFRRIHELTDGRVDAVTGQSIATYLLPHAQDRLRRAEIDHRRAVEQLQGILDALPLQIALLDSSGNIELVNTEWREFPGQTDPEHSGHVGWNYLTVCDSAHGQGAETAAEVASGLRSVFRELAPSYTCEYPCATPSAEHWFRLRVVPFGGSQIRGAVVLHEDVTEEKVAAQRLARSESRFRAIAHATADVIWDWDFHTRQLWCSNAFENLFGHKPPDITDLEGWIRLVHPEDRERVVSGLRAVLEQRLSHWRDRLRCVRADGSLLEVEGSGYLIVSAQGEPDRFVGGLHDVTERMQGVARLAQQAALLDEAEDAIVVAGVDGRITFWNRGAEAVYGWRAEEVLGHAFSHYPATEPELFTDAFSALLSTGHWAGQLRQKCKSGAWRTVSARWKLVRDTRNEPSQILAINTDITDRLALEQKLQEAHRLDAIGKLTGGIAHDFNNLLTVIVGNAELLRTAADDKDIVSAATQTILEAADRAAKLTARLLTFARRQSLTPRLTDLNEVVVRFANTLLKRTFPESIAVHVLPSATRCWALADAAQLETVLLNLCINARDAMGGSGTLTIETAVSLDAEAEQPLQAEGIPVRSVAVSVSDTGAGMTAEVLERACEPFFTTKAAGKGTGLGLSMAYGFAKQSGGDLVIESAPGRGTSVTVRLPWAEAPPDATDAGTVQQSAPLAAGGARVLVVEDNELVRNFAQRTLQSLGYSVAVAADAPQALDILRGGQVFDVLFSDIVMPGGMSGRELARQVRHEFPNVRVLLTSGYDDETFDPAHTNDEFRLLRKPYGASQLSGAIRSAFEVPQS